MLSTSSPTKPLSISLYNVDPTLEFRELFNHQYRWTTTSKNNAPSLMLFTSFLKDSFFTIFLTASHTSLAFLCLTVSSIRSASSPCHPDFLMSTNFHAPFAAPELYSACFIPFISEGSRSLSCHSFTTTVTSCV